jgi:hypothetical protein
MSSVTLSSHCTSYYFLRYKTGDLILRLSKNLVALSCLSLLTASQFAVAGAQAQSASPNKTTKTKPAGDDFDGDRSLNMFQVEPTVINEKYYTSGKAEHHQYVGKTLPFGAEIPDNDGPVNKKVEPKAEPKVETKKPPSTSSVDFKKLEFGKLDSQVIDRLADLQNIKNDSPALKLHLHVSTIDQDLVSHLKALRVDVISSVPASGDMVIYAPARNVGDVGHLKEVMMVGLAQ